MFQKNVHAKAGERFVQDREKWLVQDNEQQFAQDGEDAFTRDVERRLGAYYGPALPVYPLLDTSWLRLRAQLSTPTRSRRQRFLPLGRAYRRRSCRTVPLELQQIYATLLLQTNYRHPSPNLRVQFSSRAAQPRVRADGLGRGRIGLVLPRENWQTLQKAELDMLLAAGLARCSGVSRSLLFLPRALFAVSLLFVLGALPFTSVDRRAVWIFLVAVTCCLVSGRVLVWQQRVLAFRGDRVAVQWLGRERVCQGLHLLAEHGQSRRRPTWGEPSLVERIARVCGTPTPSKEKRLTLVS